MAKQHIQDWQRIVGVATDGDFGPRTLAASMDVFERSDTEPPPTEPTGGFVLGEQSRKRLAGVHPDLVKVVEQAARLSPMPFVVLEGLRTKERQAELVKKGASKTMNSRHLTGHAVDCAPLIDGKASWHWPHYHELNVYFVQAAKDVGVPIDWGGDWPNFADGPHRQLPWKSYPS
jgi:peptidoglycan L-alanyl-D-glutamate endopeptidase CwlK